MTDIDRKALALLGQMGHRPVAYGTGDGVALYIPGSHPGLFAVGLIADGELTELIVNNSAAPDEIRDSVPTYAARLIASQFAKSLVLQAGFAGRTLVCRKADGTRARSLLDLLPTPVPAGEDVLAGLIRDVRDGEPLENAAVRADRQGVLAGFRAYFRES